MFPSALVYLLVGLLVCLLATQLKKLWMDFDEIFRKCQKCNEEQVIICLVVICGLCMSLSILLVNL